MIIAVPVIVLFLGAVGFGGWWFYRHLPAHLLSSGGQGGESAEQRAVLDAVIGGDVKKILELPLGGAKLNFLGADGNSPLALALMFGHNEMAMTLVKRGADLHLASSGLLPIHTASILGNVAMVKMLLDNGVDVDELAEVEGLVPLHTAAGGDSLLTTLQQFMDTAFTAEQLAKREPFKPDPFATVQLLLSHHPKKINNLNAAGESPLQYAATLSNDVRIIELLQKAGANLDLADGDKNTPLINAIETDRLDAAKALIKAKADLNRKGAGGRTALHVAVEHDSAEAIKFLIAAGAKTNLTDDQGMTAQRIAKENEDKELIKSFP